MANSNVVDITAEPGRKEIIIRESFDAPRELVWKACTDPTLIPQWWGPRRYTTTVEKIEVRPGGAWRFVQRGPDGKEEAFKGTFETVKPPDQLTYTFEWEGMPGHIMRESETFQERDGKTEVTITDQFQTVEDRDGMFQSGMREGTTESAERLAELLKQMK